MPFLRYANARVTHPHVRDGGWDRVRVASGKMRQDRNLVEQASKILHDEFDPKKYLLTHATIVASVDTEEVKNIKLGKSTENGKHVVRKTANFRIKADCEKFINNNMDSWARPVLLKAYPTFIGAHSFVEHVQIENLSKGRIIDAVARDVGDSVYIDILVANARKHAQLIKDIESGELSTLSMGCSIDGSTCTKCGHWAADETEFCDHIRHEKGNTFFDENGVKHCIAELCGDESLEPTGGVNFIEASWVKVPAFTGAVARNVISVDSEPEKKKAAQKIRRVFQNPALKPSPNAMRKAASFDLVSDMFDEDSSMDAPPPAEEAPETPDPNAPALAPESGSPLKGIQDDLKKFILDNVKDQLRTELSKSEIEDQVLPNEDAPNDTIVKQAKFVKLGMRQAYTASLRALVASSTSEADLMNRVATLNHEMNVDVHVSLYRGALKVGARSSYRDLHHFMKAAAKSLGRSPTFLEARTMIRLASLLDARRYPTKGRSGS